MRMGRKLLFGVLCVVVILGLTIPISAPGGATSTISYVAKDLSIPADAAPAPISKIAFASERDGNSEIYVMNADGSNQIRLTNDIAFDGEPKWSPDGSKIAFISDRDGVPDIYVMRADGANQTRLTTGTFALTLTWSPDGTKMAFSNEIIWVMNADGTGQTMLATVGTNRGPAWSPDGSRIAFHSDRDNPAGWQVYVMNVDGSGQTNLTNTSGREGRPAWSPDGSRIAFQSERDGNVEIYVMNADGSNQTRLTVNTAPDEISGGAWSPDGSRIAFQSERDGNLEIYVMKADGSNQTRITYNPAWDYVPAWSPLGAVPAPPGGLVKISPDNNPLPAFKWNAAASAASYEVQIDSGTFTDIGNKLTYVQPIILSKGAHTFSVREKDISNTPGPAATLTFNVSVVADLANTKIGFSANMMDAYLNIYVMNSDFTSPVRLTYGGWEDGNPMWSPDGTKIVFNSSRDRIVLPSGYYGVEVYVMNADGSNQTRLTNNLAAQNWFPAWSPDGTKIAFSSSRDGDREIYVMNADGSNQTRLTNNPALDDDPSWSPDGTRIAFTSTRNGHWEIYVMNADGFNQTRVTTSPPSFIQGLFSPSWSPDGSKIAMNSGRPDGYDSYIVNSDGSNLTNLTPGTPEEHYKHMWSPDGSKLTFWYAQTVNHAWTIATMNTDGTNLSVLVNNAGMAIGQSSWSPFLV